EDGIRVLIVTGVQTCALPILPAPTGERTIIRCPGCKAGLALNPAPPPLPPKPESAISPRGPAAGLAQGLASGTPPPQAEPARAEIGRAAATGRSSGAVGGARR